MLLDFYLIPIGLLLECCWIMEPTTNGLLLVCYNIGLLVNCIWIAADLLLSCYCFSILYCNWIDTGLLMDCCCSANSYLIAVGLPLDC